MSPCRLLILYGSQTGNSEDVAEQIGRAALQRRFFPTIMAMNAFDVARLIREQVAVFIASTTGQGEVPDNMKIFWRFLLRKSLPADSLSSLRHAVFGLGDSGYQQYNVVAKKLDRRLEALGSVALVERGLGDDQHFAGYDSNLDVWLTQLWGALQTLWPNHDQSLVPGSTEALPRCKFTINGDVPAQQAASVHEEEIAAGIAFAKIERAAAGMGSPSQGQQQLAGSGPDRPFMASVIANHRITHPDHSQDTRHIELDLQGSGLTYEPGDILSVIPRQDPAAVAAFLERTQLDGEAWVRVSANAPSQQLNGAQSAKVRVGALVAGALDVHGASPRRFFFEMMAHFASAPHEVERLQYFSSLEGRDDLATYNAREGRTALEVLQDFPSAQVPLQWLLHIVPRLKTRQFSIASSMHAHPAQAHILAAVVDYRTPHRRRKLGLCTAWLAQLRGSTHGMPANLRDSGCQNGVADAASPKPAPPPDSCKQTGVSTQEGHASHREGQEQVPVWVSRGVLCLPPDPGIPLILVGPGTGVAPFRAFLEDRAAMQAAGTRVAPCYLYFGCRGESKDYYYHIQWEEYVRRGVLASEGGLVTAFSGDGASKVYVTHRIRQHAQQLYQLLTQGANIYISGSAKHMPQDVIAAFEEAVAEQGSVSQQEATTFMKRLQANRRCVIEAWS